jgi:hypothetical protein
MMARLVRVMASMRRRKELPSTAPPGDGEQQREPPAQAKARTMACCMSVSRAASWATSRNEPSDRVRPKPVSLVRSPSASGRRRSGLRHEVDDAVDRRHARQVADHDAAVGRLQQIEDRPARAEVHAPRDLLGKAVQARCGCGPRRAGSASSAARRHVVLHRCRRRTYTVANRRAGRSDEQAGVEQRQPEARRPQDAAERATRGARMT